MGALLRRHKLPRNGGSLVFWGNSITCVYIWGALPAFTTTLRPRLAGPCRGIMTYVGIHGFALLTWQLRSEQSSWIGFKKIMPKSRKMHWTTTTGTNLEILMRSYKYSTRSRCAKVGRTHSMKFSPIWISSIITSRGLKTGLSVAHASTRAFTWLG
jgi:hypothetical protein